MSEALRFRESAPGCPDVRLKEVEEILVQRKNRGLPQIETLEETVGLAVSGGGIRSATFGLGVMQELREQGLLDRVDYLSTVSGGGYIGGWFVGNRLRREAEGKEDAFLNDEHEAVRHLRRFGRYLTPKTGFLSADTWTAFAIWLRNTLSIQLLLLILVMLMLLLPHLALPLFYLAAHRELLGAFYLHMGLLVVSGALAFGCLLRVRASMQPARGKELRGVTLDTWMIGLGMLAGMLTPALLWGALLTQKMELNPWERPTFLLLAGTISVLTIIVRVTCREGRLDWRAGVSLLIQGGMVFLLTMLMAFVAVEMMLVFWRMETVSDGAELMRLVTAKVIDPTEISARAQLLAFEVEWPLILGGPMIVFIYSVIISAGISLAGTDVKDAYREWWARIGGWFFILSLLMAVSCAIALEGPELLAWMLPQFGGKVQALGAWIISSGLMMKLAGGSSTSGQRGGSWIKEKLVLLAPLIFFLGLMLSVAGLVEWLLDWTRGETPAVMAVLHGWGSQALAAVGWERPFILSTTFLENDAHILLLATTLGALLYLLMAFFDINELSMNQFYRNRLMRCYLGASRTREERSPEVFTGFDFGDDMKIADLRTSAAAGFRGPFWIVNTALNTAKNPDLDVAERLAESFTITPVHCGVERRGLGVGSDVPVPQGYRPTAEYMANSLSAAAAISISGAAASPNSGYHTSPLIAFLLTIFNARLGWWAANPALPETWRTMRPPWYKSMGWYVLKELFGGASMNDPFIYLSDGGHFENLGLYELVRRRCKVIIVSDAEEDGGYTFHGLGTAIRRCWVDFGVRLEIDTRSISPETEGGICRGHCAIGRIVYDASDKNQDGTLVYLKSSWTGDEPTDLLQYRAANSGFPHESTGDQFFSESQFESYRKLGRHVAKTCFDASVRYLQQTDPGLLAAEKRTPGADAPTQARFLERFSETLRQYWAPLTEGSDSEFIRNTETLVNIWRDVQAQAELQWMERVILPAAECNFKERLKREVWPVDPVSNEQKLAGRFLCQRLFQLMENVYLDLDLARTTSEEDNSGWMNLFRHWARFSCVEEEWKAARPTFGERFAAFWDQQLAPLNQLPPVHSQADPKILLEYHLHRAQKVHNRLQSRLDHLIRQMRSRQV
jgi:hypothetical protein